MQNSLSPSISQKLANMGFVCALFVVSIHVVYKQEVTPADAQWWVAALLADGISHIAVPFFFVVAGFLLGGHVTEPGWWVREIRKRIRSLVLPFFAWSILFAIFFLGSTVIANVLSGVPLSRNIPEYWWWSFWNFGILESPPYNVLWFIRTLFVFILLSAPLVWVMQKGRIWLSGLTLILLVAYLWTLPFPQKEGISPVEFIFGWMGILSTRSLFAFFLGLFLRLHPIQKKPSTWICWLILLLGLGCFCLRRVCLDWETSRWLTGSLDAVGIWLSLYATWYLMTARPWPKFITSLAFPLFLVHPFVIIALGIMMRWLQALPTLTPCASYLSRTAFVIMISVGIIIPFRHAFPKLSAFLFGGRGLTKK